jgi:hypothetical protein
MERRSSSVDMEERKVDMEGRDEGTARSGEC